MAMNQLGDEGSVIGYQPNLEYIKNRNRKTNTNTTSDTSDDSFNLDDGYSYSTALQDFNRLMPSTTLSTISDSIQRVDDLIESLQKKFNKDDFAEYNDIMGFVLSLSTDAKEAAKAMLDYHHNSINGSIIPELIAILYDSKQHLLSLEQTLKYLFYGNKNIPIVDAESIDTAYRRQMQIYEQVQKKAKINYFALSMDSTLTRSVYDHCFNVNRGNMEIAEVIDHTDNSSGDFSQQSIVNTLFKEANQEIDDRNKAYNAQQGIAIVEKSLYNYYQKRRKAIDLYDLYIDNPGSNLIKRQLSKIQQEVKDSIHNVNRTILSREYYLTQMSELERDKYLVMNIYSTFNYNS